MTQPFSHYGEGHQVRFRIQGARDERLGVVVMDLLIFSKIGRLLCQ